LDILIWIIFGIVVLASIVGIVFFVRSLLRDRKRFKETGIRQTYERKDVVRTLIVLALYLIAYIIICYFLFTVALV
jgi:uncharacterized membrane protein YbhN (UPF0104 family)